MTKEDAIQTYWDANRSVQELMLAQAQAHAQARMQMSAALEQRVSATAALLLAAAAVAAQMAWDLKEGPIVALAALGAVAFTVGGATTLTGVGAGVLRMPGADPAWWAASRDAISGFDGPRAECWIIGHYYDTISDLKALAERRANALNFGLRYGLAGSIFLALAAILAIFR